MKHLVRFVTVFGRLAVMAAALALGACDGSNNRYELSKDAAGNTVRLDKRTGEVAIIQGDQLRTVKDAQQADADRKAKVAQLEKEKSWPGVDIPQFGVRADLSTTWRDGKMYYQFGVQDLDGYNAMMVWLSAPKEKRGEFPVGEPKKRQETLTKALAHTPFEVELSDGGGFLINGYSVARMTRIVDDKGMPQSLEKKDSVPMSEDEYSRISTWNLRWH